MSKLLLLSNSTMPGTSFFSWPKLHVQNFLGPFVRDVVFIPFAAVSISYDVYFETVSKAFKEMGYALRSVHQVSDKRALIMGSEAIVAGGGNTFALLNKMYEFNILEAVQKRMGEDASYVAWSAGANVACPTIKTTNDMPIVLPPSFDALKLIPFQINPHYHELRFENQGGETRRERLVEYIQMNPESSVVGLPEGMLLERNGNNIRLQGSGTAKLFQSGKSIREISSGENLSFLL